MQTRSRRSTFFRRKPRVTKLHEDRPSAESAGARRRTPELTTARRLRLVLNTDFFPPSSLTPSQRTASQCVCKIHGETPRPDETTRILSRENYYVSAYSGTRGFLHILPNLNFL